MRFFLFFLVVIFISCSSKNESIFDFTPNKLLSEADYLLNKELTNDNDKNVQLVSGRIIIEYLFNPDNSKIELVFNDSILKRIYNKREELLKDPNYNIFQEKYFNLKKEILQSKFLKATKNSDCKEPDTSGQFMNIVVSRIKNQGCAISSNFFKGNGSYIIQAVCPELGGPKEFEVLVNECGDIL